LQVISRFIKLVLATFCTIYVQAQTFKSTVVNAQNKQPIADVSVFISNTSVGTTTALNGQFELTRFPSGRFDLVISCVGYETKVINTTSIEILSIKIIELQPKINQLDEVVLEPYEKNGWDKWGSFFIEQFIGTSDFGKQCKLLNSSIVKFRFNKKRNILTAYADEAILIENKALGYLINYKLTNFEFNFSTRIFYYQGYPLFQEMKSTRAGRLKNWQENRVDAYNGSLMHFMRSLYRNKLVEQGFEVRKIIRKENLEKKRVQTVMKELILNGKQISIGTDDSSMYYKNVMKQPNTQSFLINTIIPSDSIAFAIDSVTVGLEFKDYLQIVYTKKKEPIAYAEYKMRKQVDGCVSEIYLPNALGVMVFANGSYFNGINLITSEYWAWSEKMGNMLPLDYWPNK